MFPGFAAISSICTAYHRRYRVPQDIAPYKDELGEWHPPRVSGRYKARVLPNSCCNIAEFCSEG